MIFDEKDTSSYVSGQGRGIRPHAAAFRHRLAADGKLHGERRSTSAARTHRRDLPVVRLDQTLGDRQAKAKAAESWHCGIHRMVALLKGVEHPCQLRRRHANS